MSAVARAPRPGETAPAGDRLRPAAPADAPEIAVLLGQLGYPSSTDRVLDRIMRLTADGSQAVLVFESMGRVIGLATAWVGDCIERDRPIGRVTALVVAEGHRGRGVGARLLAHAEDWMRSRGAGVAIINARQNRTDAHRFYASHHYSVTGLRFTKPLTN